MPRSAGAREVWWLWGAGLAIAFHGDGLVIYPVAIAPLFNHYSPLPDSPLKQRSCPWPRANGVPADNVWLVDESRQSTRISANVSGFLGTTRISLNDNLLNQGTPDEVLAVMGHEMGHYVMGHTLREIVLLGLVTLVGFRLVAFAFRLCDGHVRRQLAGARARRCRRTAAAGGADEHFPVPGDAGDQFHCPQHRAAGRYFRGQCGAQARCLCQRGAEAVALSQARSRARWRR